MNRSNIAWIGIRFRASGRALRPGPQIVQITKAQKLRSSNRCLWHLALRGFALLRWFVLFLSLMPAGPVRSEGFSAGSPFPWERSASIFRNYPGQWDLLGGNLQTRLPISDWLLPGGVDLSVALFHNSLGAPGTSVASKWTHTLDIHLVPNLAYGDMEVRLGDGTRLMFVRNLDGSLSAPPGVRSTLVANESGWRLETDNGLVLSFARHASDRIPCRSIVSQTGSTLRIDVDSTGHAILADDGLGRWMRFQRLAGRLSRIELSNGKVWDIVHDSLGNLRQLIYPASEVHGGRAVRWFRYDTQSRIISAVDEAGGIHRFTYDASGRLSRCQDPVGAVDQVAYAANLRRWRNPVGASVEMEYDVRGRLVRETDALGRVWRTEWNPDNQSVSNTDPLGRKTTVHRDARGRPVAFTSPDGREWKLWRSPDERTVVLTLPSGRSFTTLADESGNPVASIDPSGGRRVWERDWFGQVIADTSPAGRTTRYRYDRFGNTVAEHNPDGTLKTVEYDPFGIPISWKDRAGRETRAGTDHAGKLDFVDEPGGRRWQWIRDATGRSLRVTAPDGRTWRWVHDAAGRVVEQIDPAGNVARTRYNLVGLPVAVIDASGRTTTYVWNLRGEQTGIRFPDGTTEAFRWDPCGNLIGRTDGRGVSTQWDYDTAGRLIGIRYSDRTPPVTLAYDPDDRLIRRTDGSGSTRWTWDPSDNLVRRESAAGSVTRAFDADGLPLATTIEVPGQAARTLSWVRDDSGRCIAVVLPEGNRVDYQYGVDGQLVRRKSNDGTEVRWHRGSETGWVDSLEYFGPQGALRESIGIQRDQTGRQVRVDSSVVPARSWDYDLAGRLIRETWGGMPGRSIAYAWDGSGARRGRRIDGIDETLVLDTSGRPVVQGTKRFTWDKAGNVSRIQDTREGSVWNLAWDAQSRLVSWDGTNVGDRRLDGFGELVARSVSVGPAEPALEGWDDGFGWRVVDATLELTGVEGPVARVVQGVDQSPRLTWLSPDAAGNVRWEGDQLLQWDAFGNPIDGANRAGYGLGWGYARVGPSDWTATRHRIYSPTAGIFLSRDPILAGDHWYGYADGDPVNGADPSGLETLLFIPGKLVPTRGGGRTPGRLVLVDDNGALIREWPASSGGHRAPGTTVPRGMPTLLPQGKYRVENPRRRDKAGMVRDGVGFSFDLLPNFPTRRSSLRIHPDGGPPGTQGCIGIGGDRRGLEDFYRRVQAILKSETMSLVVR